MEDLFKKFIYTGVGLVALTAEKVQGVVDSLVDEGKISTEEGKKIVSDLVDNTEAKRDEFEQKLRGMMEDILAKLKLAPLTEVETLKARIEALEEQLSATAAAPAAEPAEAAAKKAATTKTADK